MEDRHTVGIYNRFEKVESKKFQRIQGQVQEIAERPGAADGRCCLWLDEA